MLEPGDVGPHRPQPGCIVSIAYLLTATPSSPIQSPENPNSSNAAAPASDHLDTDGAAADGAAEVNGAAAAPMAADGPHADGAPAADSQPRPSAAGQAAGAGNEGSEGLAQHLEQGQGLESGGAEGSMVEASAGRGRLLLEAQGAARFEYGAGGVAPEVEALVDEIGGVGGCARCTVRRRRWVILSICG